MIENFTKYTEVDPDSSQLYKPSDHGLDAYRYIYADFGKGYFSNELQHLDLTTNTSKKGGEEAMTKEDYIKGTRIECIKSCGGKIKVGMTGTIVRTSITAEMLAIEWDEFVNGHSCSNEARQGYCWNISVAYVKLISTTKPNLNEEEHDMSIVINSTIGKVFTDIPTAELITKFVGREYEEGNHRALLDLETHKGKVLKYCKDEQKKEADSMKR